MFLTAKETGKNVPSCTLLLWTFVLVLYPVMISSSEQGFGSTSAAAMTGRHLAGSSGSSSSTVLADAAEATG